MLRSTSVENKLQRCRVEVVVALTFSLQNHSTASVRPQQHLCRLPGVDGGAGVALQEGDHQGPFQQEVQLAGQTLRIPAAELLAQALQQSAATRLEGHRRLAGPIAGFGVFAGRLDEQAAVERGPVDPVRQPVEHRQDPLPASFIPSPFSVMFRLHGHELSGNSYKVRLLLELLGLPYEWVRVDLMAGEHKQEPFLALNPFGQVPVLEDGDTILCDAQAILYYLAARQGDGQWLPSEPLEQARVVRWLSTAAGEVRQGPENARLFHLFGVRAIGIERAHEKGAFILAQLERHLSERQWLELDRPTIADIAVFPYVALAGWGRSGPLPHVQAWIGRIQALRTTCR